MTCMPSPQIRSSGNSTPTHCDIRSHWGGAYNRELKWLMLRHAFLFVSSVIFVVGPENLRSQLAVEKIGGVQWGSEHQEAARPNVVYRIEAGSWVDAAV